MKTFAEFLEEKYGDSLDETVANRNGRNKVISKIQGATIATTRKVIGVGNRIRNRIWTGIDKIPGNGAKTKQQPKTAGTAIPSEPQQQEEPKPIVSHSRYASNSSTVKFGNLQQQIRIESDSSGHRVTLRTPQGEKHLGHIEYELAGKEEKDSAGQIRSFETYRNGKLKRTDNKFTQNISPKFFEELQKHIDAHAGNAYHVDHGHERYESAKSSTLEIIKPTENLTQVERFRRSNGF